MKTLDCRGLACPQPVMRTRDALEQERPQELLVLVDNAAASENVSRFLRRSGFEVSVSQPESSLWEVRGLGGATQVESPEQAPAAAPAVDTENLKTLVLITTDTLGRGDDELGARLMENFLASLPELGPSLWRIVLLNGGVKLAATEGKCLTLRSVPLFLCPAPDPCRPSKNLPAPPACSLMGRALSSSRISAGPGRISPAADRSQRSGSSLQKTLLL